LLVAVIGAGFIGMLHRKAWEANGASVKVMVDPFLPEDKKRSLRAEGVEVMDDLDAAYALCPDIEAVSICTPPGDHPADLTAALRRGAAVLLEKPVAVNKRAYLSMLREAEERGAKVMIGLTQRFYPEVRQAAAWIREGKIGRPVSLHDAMILNGDGLPRWYEDLDMSGGGVWITNGVHLLDRLQFLLDRSLGTLYHADISKDERGLDRMADVSGTLSDGMPFHLHLKWSRVQAFQRTIIYGTEGSIELETWRQAVLYDASGEVVQVTPYRQEESFEQRTLRGLIPEIRTFVEGLQGEFPAGLTLDGHLPTMEAIWQAYDMAQRSRL